MKIAQHNKAQINQVFVWIIVALVIGATALFGARSIGGLLQDKCSIDIIRFEDKLRETISLNNDFGSVNLESLSAPCDYRKVCLADARPLEDKDSVNKDIIIDASQPDPEMDDYYRLIQSSVEDHVEDNIFLFNGKELKPAGYISQVRIGLDEDAVKQGYNSQDFDVLCVDAKAGKFNFILQGLGRNTWVKSVGQHTS